MASALVPHKGTHRRASMKSQVAGDLALPISMYLKSLADLPVPLSIVPAYTLFNYFIKWRPIRAIWFLTINCVKIVLL